MKRLFIKYWKPMLLVLIVQVLVNLILMGGRNTDQEAGRCGACLLFGALAPFGYDSSAVCRVGDHLCHRIPDSRG